LTSECSGVVDFDAGARALGTSPTGAHSLSATLGRCGHSVSIVRVRAEATRPRRISASRQRPRATVPLQGKSRVQPLDQLPVQSISSPSKVTTPLGQVMVPTFHTKWGGRSVTFATVVSPATLRVISPSD